MNSCLNIVISILIIFNSSETINGGRNLTEGSWCQRSFDKRSGYCLAAYQCTHVIRDHLKFGAKIDICTYRNSVRIVCCPLADKMHEELRISTKTCQKHNAALEGIKLTVLPTPLTSTHESTSQVCITKTYFVVGGSRTLQQEYPHMTAVGWTRTNKQQIHWSCAGVLINNRFVLTAAHCITTELRLPDVIRAGGQDITTNQQQTANIQKIHIHPKFKSFAHYHDVALLELSTPVTFTASVQPACLWPFDNINVSHTLTATGWAEIIRSSKTPTAPIVKVDLELFKVKTCQQMYGTERRLQRGVRERQQFCAGRLQGGKDTCHGDSGGPVHVQTPEFNCVKFVVGITSFGKLCAAPRTPAVYTKIYPYLNWIEKIAFHTN